MSIKLNFRLRIQLSINCPYKLISIICIMYVYLIRAVRGGRCIMYVYLIRAVRGGRIL